MTEKFDQFCIVELMGHNVLAGKVTEQTIGGQAFVRVDVPATEKQDSYTKLYGAGAIYCLTPCDEATCLAAVNGLQPVPMNPWSLNINPNRLLSGSDDELDLDDE